MWGWVVGIGMAMLVVTVWYFAMDLRMQAKTFREKQLLRTVRDSAWKLKLENAFERKVKEDKKVQFELLAGQAGISIRYGEFQLYSWLSIMVVSSLVYFSTHNPILSVMLGGLSYAFPKQLLLFLKNRRTEALEKQVGSLLKLLLKRYENQGNLATALTSCLEEFVGEYPIYRDLLIAEAELKTGEAPEKVFRKLAEHTDNAYLLRFINYYEIADGVADNKLRIRLLQQVFWQYEKKRKKKAAMLRELASLKKEAYTLIGAVPVFAVWQTFTQKNYLYVMSQTLVGQVAVAGVSLVLLGIIWVVNNKLSAPLK